MEILNSVALITYNVSDVKMASVPNFTKMFKNVKLVEFHYYIWIYHEKCIQMGTNMPSIGSVFREIRFEFGEFQKTSIFCMIKNQCLIK